MKIDFRKQLVENDSTLAFAVTEGLSDAAIRLVSVDPAYVTSGELDIAMTVNGHTVDVEAVCQTWQDQVDRMINERAAELVNEKFNAIDELVAKGKRAVLKQLGIDVDATEDW